MELYVVLKSHDGTVLLVLQSFSLSFNSVLMVLIIIDGMYAVIRLSSHSLRYTAHHEFTSKLLIRGSILMIEVAVIFFYDK